MLNDGDFLLKGTPHAYGDINNNNVIIIHAVLPKGVKFSSGLQLWGFIESVSSD